MAAAVLTGPSTGSPLLEAAVDIAWQSLAERSGLNSALLEWETLQAEAEQSFEQFFGEFDQCCQRFRGQELHLHEQRLRLGESRSQARQEWEAEQQDIHEEYQQQIQDLERKQSELQNAVGNARERTTELNQQLSEQKRHLARERENWNEEFQKLRAALDKQMSATTAPRNELRAPAATEVPPSGVGESTNRTSATGDGVPIADPVLGSVMAQFQLLQRDVARRRAQSQKRQNEPTP